MIVVDPRPEKVRELRYGRWTSAATGEQLSIIEDDPTTVILPPYFAELILIGNSTSFEPTQLKRVYESLRPFGGKLMARLNQELPDDLGLENSTNLVFLIIPLLVAIRTNKFSS